MGGGFHILLVGVDALDEGDADDEGVTGFCYAAYVVKDQFVADARIAAVLLGVHQFQVDQQQFALMGDAVDDIGLGIERGVDRAMEPAASQLLQEFKGILRKHQRLAATKGDAAPTVLHDVALLFNLGHQLVHRVLATANLACGGGTVVDDKALL